MLWISPLKECALIKNDHEALSRLYNAVTLIKVALSFALFVPAIILSFAMHSSVLLYLFMWVTIASQTLVPVWLYQGLQKLFGYLVFSILAQVFSAILTISLVRSANDLFFVTLSSALVWSITAFAANRSIIKELGIKLSLPSFKYLKSVLDGAWHIFVANVAISYYVNLPALMVSLLATKLETGVFMGAQKLIFGLQALITPLSAAVFPITSTLSQHSIEEANKFVKKLILYTVAAMFVGVNILSFYAEEIVKLLLGAEFKASAGVLEIMAVGPLFVALSVIIANHILIVRGHAPRLKNLYFVIAVIATLVAYPLIRDYHAVGAAWLYVVVEFAVFIGLVWISRDINLELKRES